jgi:hypothetical protein
VQVRALYNEKSKEFHKVLIIVLGSALFCRLFGALYTTIVKGGDLNSVVVFLIETKQESIAYLQDFSIKECGCTWV